jgi:hypothetical protein
MVSSGDYAHGPVPTVFVEPTPLPPPPPPRRDEEKGGLVISKGFLGALVVLLLGAAIAGTGFFWFQANNAQKTIGERDKQIAALKSDIDTRDKTIGLQKADLTARDATIAEFNLKYGELEKLDAAAAAEKKNIEEVLTRRPPNTPGIPDKLKNPPAWRDGAVQALKTYVDALHKEFVRIDAPRPTVTVNPRPTTPDLRPNGG